MAKEKRRRVKEDKFSIQSINDSKVYQYESHEVETYIAGREPCRQICGLYKEDKRYISECVIIRIGV